MSFVQFLQKKIPLLPQSALLGGSIVLFIGNMFSSAGSYLYHLLMGRMLGPASYGILESLFSLIYLLAVPMATLGLVVVRFVSIYAGKKEQGKIDEAFTGLSSKFLFWGFIGLILFLMSSPLISSFLHLGDNFSLILIGFIALAGLFTTINRSFLQALLRFKALTGTYIIEILFKVILAVFFVWLGFGISGAIFPMLLGAVAVYGFTVWVLQKKVVFDFKKRGFSEDAKMLRYGLPVFFSMLAFTSLYTTDVVLVRHFLPATETGLYAALAVLGKILFFASYPIVMVMFPLISQRSASGQRYKNLLFISLFLVSLICGSLNLLYWLLPELMVQVLFGAQFLVASPYLFLFSLFLTFYCLSYLLTNFFLSIGKVKIVILPSFAAVSQIVFICLFHQTISQVIWVSLLVSALLFISQVLYYAYALAARD